MFYKILESVGQYYIVLDGIYSTREAAQKALERLPSHDRMRVQAYQRGAWDGPVWVPDVDVQVRETSL